MPRAAKGHVEQLPSGSFWVSVYAGVDPLTRQQIRLRSTVKDERLAQIELGRLLKEASNGRTPETDATVARLLDEYVPVAGWELSTREANEGYIRRTIKPALGHLQVRKIRGPILDKLYVRLMRCGDLSCTGRPFTEHRRVPVLIADPADHRPGWEQAAGRLRDAIVARELAPADPLPSVRELNDLQGVRTATIQHAFAVLADEQLIILRHGRTAVVAGEAEPSGGNGHVRRPGRSHDCKLAGCRPHVCKPMKARTIRNIHSILSGAFATAKRWDWIDWNPAESARPPTVAQRPLPATAPEDVAAVIAEGRVANPKMAVYLWLAAITGARRGELCALQVCDIDLALLIHAGLGWCGAPDVEKCS
jgi:DNA-binding transcriptional regulator YhcF (GntR family)